MKNVMFPHNYGFEIDPSGVNEGKVKIRYRNYRKDDNDNLTRNREDDSLIIVGIDLKDIMELNESGIDGTQFVNTLRNIGDHFNPNPEGSFDPMSLFDKYGFTQFAAFHDMGPDGIMWQDEAMTIPADHDDPVRVVEDMTENNHHWTVPQTDNPPTRKIDDDKGWLQFDGTANMTFKDSSITNYIHQEQEHTVMIGARPTETTTFNSQVFGLLSTVSWDWWQSEAGYVLWYDPRNDDNDLKFEVGNGSNLQMSITASNEAPDSNMAILTDSDAHWGNGFYVNGNLISWEWYFNPPASEASQHVMKLGYMPNWSDSYMEGRVYGTFFHNVRLEPTDRANLMQWMQNRF